MKVQSRLIEGKPFVAESDGLLVVDESAVWSAHRDAEEQNVVGNWLTGQRIKDIGILMHILSQDTKCFTLPMLRWFIECETCNLKKIVYRWGTSRAMKRL